MYSFKDVHPDEAYRSATHAFLSHNTYPGGGFDSNVCCRCALTVQQGIQHGLQQPMVYLFVMIALRDIVPWVSILASSGKGRLLYIIHDLSISCNTCPDMMFIGYIHTDLWIWMNGLLNKSWE